MITFPRVLPAGLKTVGMAFDPAPMLEITPLRSGGRIGLDIGPTLWRASSWSAAAMGEADFGVVRAWYATLTSVRTFLAYDVLRAYPVLYKSGWGAMTVGGDPFDGTCQLTDVSEDAYQATLGGLPVGLVLSPGDYLAWWYGAGGTFRALHMVVSGGAADGSGNLTVEVRPEIRPGWQPTAPAVCTVDLHRPTAEMAIVPGSWSAPYGRNRTGTVSFEAVQVFPES